MTKILPGKILLTNDDGFDAPGLRASYDAMVQFLTRRGDPDPTSRLIVVAPDRCRSECSHSVTTGRDLKLIETAPNWFSLDGTPVDCVRVALSTLCSDAVAVVSGVNAGANVGIDLLVSGTFAGAREGAIQARPSIAISHYRKPDVPKTWHCTGDWLQPVLEDFWHSSVESNHHPTTPLWNVNLPAVMDPGIPPIAYCDIETAPMNRVGQRTGGGRDWTIQMRSDFHHRPRAAGTDIDQCFGGKITISKLSPGRLC